MPAFPFSRPLGVVALSVSATAAFFPLPTTLRAKSRAMRPAVAAPALDTAIARMGGEDALKKIERVRFEMMTLWQRMSFEDRQSDLIGSYELHTDLRNYALGAWRNTRRFVTLERKLNPRHFARVHRSAIVNLARVRELQPMFGGEYVIILSTGAKLTLSRGYRDAFRDRLGSEL